ncbi:hypothetical protein P152DRAFT_461789 [Eremomyces bilateralis CBS 781.70]|uniref:Integral membrane protein n=1 Tax=Eremomyces bilateralis CBS 781.70 TaxID=1392243 RepID=A0A6G1FTR0_9PEZI|nr:uncharacterized protein P152DRAFT_461789 [Eremomyces bilateralis CBS 781.70]KAF1809143.1 hypothetical protein P152DRAFT_461789 [Eremomyces bilateralis CBS 781.70]
MSDNAALRSGLFKTAAILSLLSTAGHIKMGLDEIYPQFKALQNPRARRAAHNGWDYINVTMLLSALLNWQWAKKAPESLEDKGMLAVLAVGGAFMGFRYGAVGEWRPIVTYWGIPTIAIAATLL